MGKNHKKLLNNLEDIRKSAGLTQQELSIKAEVSRISKDKQNPQVFSLEFLGNFETFFGELIRI